MLAKSIWLTITGFPDEPRDPAGADIFELDADFFALHGPVPGTGPFAFWTFGATGSYSIELGGATYGICPWDLTGDDTVGVGDLLALFASWGPCPPEIDAVVVPNANESEDGNNNNIYPFFVTGGMRYQQVYDSSQFGSFGGKRLITHIVFRPDSTLGDPHTTHIFDLEVSLSTVNIGPDGLSTTFADNLGPDNTLVHGGFITLSTSDLAGPGNTRAFDIVIALQTPFSYDPTTGRNLLLDVRLNDLNVPAGGPRAMDAEFTQRDSISRIFAIGPGSPTGLADSLGLITLFRIVVSSCPDFNSDGTVGVGDMLIMFANWGPCP